MWPFKNEWQDRMKITLTDGQEFEGKSIGGDVAVSPWVSVTIGGEKIYYPAHRVQDVRVWREKIS